MLEREHRLSREAFAHVQRKGRVFRGQYATLRIAPSTEASGFSTVVSRKVAKSAVGRHRVRRRVYEALRTAIMPVLNGAYHAIVIVHPTATELSFSELVAEMKKLFAEAAATVR